MVKYIANPKTCSRNRCVEGNEDPDGGIVTFSIGMKQCDRCIERSRRSQHERTKMSPKRHYPAPDKCVYAFFEGNEMVYIGESSNTSFRISEHFCRKNHGTWSGSPFIHLNPLERKKRFRYEILWYGDNDEYRKHQEKELIKLHQPKYNKTH